MARAIKFTEDYGQVLVVIPSEKKGGKPTKEYQGGFKKGDVWPSCSKQLAQKLVNRKGVAEFVEAEAGDDLKKSHGNSAQVAKDAEDKANKIVEDAVKKAKEITDAADTKAKEMIEVAKKPADLT